MKPIFIYWFRSYNCIIHYNRFYNLPKMKSKNLDINQDGFSSEVSYNSESFLDNFSSNNILSTSFDPNDISSLEEREDSFRNSFAGFLSSQNTNNLSRLDSDSSKRHKSVIESSQEKELNFLADLFKSIESPNENIDNEISFSKFKDVLEPKEYEVSLIENNGGQNDMLEVDKLYFDGKETGLSNIRNIKDEKDDLSNGNNPICSDEKGIDSSNIINSQDEKRCKPNSILKDNSICLDGKGIDSLNKNRTSNINKSNNILKDNSRCLGEKETDSLNRNKNKDNNVNKPNNILKDNSIYSGVKGADSLNANILNNTSTNNNKPLNNQITLTGSSEMENKLTNKNKAPSIQELSESKNRVNISSRNRTQSQDLYSETQMDNNDFIYNHEVDMNNCKARNKHMNVSESYNSQDNISKDDQLEKDMKYIDESKFDLINSGFKTANEKIIEIDKNLINNNIVSDKIDLINKDIIDMPMNNNKSNTCLSNNKSQSDNKDLEINSGFITANNKTVLINKNNIKKDIIEDEIKTLNNENEMIFSGFKSATNKEILMKPNLIDYSITDKGAGGIFKKDYNIKHENIIESNDDSSMRIIGLIKNKSVENNLAQQTKIDKADIKMKEIYGTVLKIFKKQEAPWIKETFKWVWMHLFVNDLLYSESLESDICSLMNFRLRSEHSVLRRIVEFDDSAYKFMILGIISIDRDNVTLYDGFYSLKFEIDVNIRNMLTINKCRLGSRLYVFGSTLLLKSATSIFEITQPPLKLNYNGLRICNEMAILGAAKTISFLNKISKIRSDGGDVSAIIVKIKRIIEIKFLVVYENYRNHVTDLEAEIEKICDYARKANFELDFRKITVKKYAKAIVSDDSGECLLTWWGVPDIKTNETYKFIFLTPVSYSLGLHLSVGPKTFYEKQ